MIWSFSLSFSAFSGFAPAQYCSFIFVMRSREAFILSSESITKATRLEIRISGSFQFHSRRIPARSIDAAADAEPSFPIAVFAVRLNPSRVVFPFFTSSFPCSIYPPINPPENTENPALTPIRRSTDATFSRNAGSRSRVPFFLRVSVNFCTFSGSLSAA